MKHVSVAYAKGFNVLIGNDRSQAATMVIEAGGKEGGADNRHRGADLGSMSKAAVVKPGSTAIAML